MSSSPFDLAARDVHVGLEVGDKAFYPVTVDRKKPGWVIVTVEQQYIYGAGSFSALGISVLYRPGKLVAVTPRKNILQEDIGVLNQVFFLQDPEKPAVEFWFSQQAEGKVVA